MNKGIFATIAVVAIESAALACSCLMPPDDPAELRALAAEGMKGAVALVEIEALTAYRPGESEEVRVTRTLAGTAPKQFRVQRGPFASSASCDLTYNAGDRDMVILYSTPTSASFDLPVFGISGLCTQGMLGKPAFREEVERLLKAAQSANGERG